MKVYNISYDLRKPDQDYTGLFEKLKGYDSWWHYLKSTWLIYTDKTADQIYWNLSPHLDKDDYILIIEVGRDRQGFLPTKAWEWIRNYIG